MSRLLTEVIASHYLLHLSVGDRRQLLSHESDGEIYYQLFSLLGGKGLNTFIENKIQEILDARPEYMKLQTAENDDLEALALTPDYLILQVLTAK